MPREEPFFFELVLVNADGTEREVVSSIPFVDYVCDTHLVWSPSGKKLAYNRCSDDLGGSTNLNVLDLDSRLAKPITEGAVRDGAPSWVP